MTTAAKLYDDGERKTLDEIRAAGHPRCTPEAIGVAGEGGNRCGHTPSLHGRYDTCLAGWSGYKVVDQRSRKYTAYGYENENGACTCASYEEYK